MPAIKVLFVASANKGDITPVVLNQGRSLASEEVEVHYFGIEGKGVFGYMGNIGRLRERIRDVQPDLIHAHFSYCGFVASLAARKLPVVVSLMGSDLAGGGLHRQFTGVGPLRYLFTGGAFRSLAGGASRYLSAFFSRFVWDRTIVKSGWMAERTWEGRTAVIPNGVDLSRFLPMGGREALKQKHGFPEGKKHILFFADPARREKNFALAQSSMEFVFREDVELLPVHGLPPDAMPELINAADVVLLTSRWEGSPNIVKEAMACNCPVVATDVGDIGWLFGDEPGYYRSWPDAAHLAKDIRAALDLREKPQALNGRGRILELGLDSAAIARRITAEYNAVLEEKRHS